MSLLWVLGGEFSESDGERGLRVADIMALLGPVELLLAWAKCDVIVRPRPIFWALSVTTVKSAANGVSGSTGIVMLMLLDV